MKLCNSIGRNPTVVRMFMAEKGIELPMAEVVVRADEGAPSAAPIAEIIEVSAAASDHGSRTHPEKRRVGSY